MEALDQLVHSCNRFSPFDALLGMRSLIRLKGGPANLLRSSVDGCLLRVQFFELRKNVVCFHVEFTIEEACWIVRPGSASRTIPPIIWVRSARLLRSRSAKPTMRLQTLFRLFGVNTMRPWPFARVAAHRGCGTTAPENTLAGFRRGLELGYRAIETDAMLAADKIPVIMHDEKFGRTILDDPRSVPELSAAEIRMLDAGRYYAPQYAGEPPAGFEQVVRWCRANDVWMNIEIKPAKGFELETGRVVGALTAKLYADVIVEGGATQAGISVKAPLFSSFKPDALRGAKEAAPNIPRGFLIDEIPSDWKDVVRELECVSLHCNFRRVTPAFIKEVKDMGLWLFCYTPNDPDVIRALLRAGVDAVCTDRIDIVSPAL